MNAVTGAVYNDLAYNVRLPAVSGEMGVSEKHAATFSELQPGVITIYKTNGDSNPLKFLVGSGTCMIDNSGCDVSIAEAIPLEHIDMDALKTKYLECKAEVTAAANTDDDHRKAIANASFEIVSRLVCPLATFIPTHASNRLSVSARSLTKYRVRVLDQPFTGRSRSPLVLLC